MRQARQQERGGLYLWTWTRWSLPRNFRRVSARRSSFQKLIIEN